MVLTVTEDTPADMLAGSMELLVQMPLEHQVQTQRVTVQRSTPMMDLLVQIATAHKLAAASYSLQAIGERGLVLAHQPNTPVGALDALQLKLLPKQPPSLLPRQSRQAGQPFETTFRLQVHLPRNQLYVARVSPKTILAEILEQVCREKNLDRSKYELRHPANLSEKLDPSLTLHDYQLQEVTLYPRQQRPGALMGSSLSSQDIMALQKQEECRRQQARHSVFGFIFKKSKESPRSHSQSLSTDSLGTRTESPAHSDETPTAPVPPPQQQISALPSRPHRKRRPAPKPPTQQQQSQQPSSAAIEEQQQQQELPRASAADKDKIVISHSRNSSDSSGYHEASVLSDNPDNSAMQPRMPETLPRRSRMQGILENTPRRLGQTSHASKSLGNLALASTQQLSLSRGVSNTSLNSAGQRKKRAAPPPPTSSAAAANAPGIARVLPSSISPACGQGLERITDSDESLTSDIDLSKPSSDIDLGPGPVAASSKASSDIACHSVHAVIAEQPEHAVPDKQSSVEPARVVNQELTVGPPVARPRKTLRSGLEASRASLGSSGSSRSPSLGPESASFGLPSLTEDEREEIALAIESIDSIVKAARAHDEQVLQPPDLEGGEDEVFVEEVPEAFRDEREQRNLASRSCAVISTIPKCEHLEPLDEQQFEQQQQQQSTEGDDKAPKKRTKVARSQSDTNNFDLGPAEKHARHLTSNGEAFTFALNPNLGEAAARGIAAASGKIAPMDTDILLQKVSDTLSHTLSPPSPPPTPESPTSLETTNFAGTLHSTVEPAVDDHTLSAPLVETSEPSTTTSFIPKESTSAADERLVSSSDRADSNNSSSSSTGNSDARLGSATSDYVSSTGEELSIADWEYQQIPAPPSAFRDDTQQTAANEPLASEKNPPSAKTEEQSTDVVDATVEVYKPQPQSFAATQLSREEKQELKKAQVIGELESKIQSNKPIVEPAAPKEEMYASPTIAPAENNLSNFTITTYSRKKSLDIFEPMDEQSRLHSETRVLSTFATLTRGKNLASEYADDGLYGPSALKSAQSMERVTLIPALQDRASFVTERTDLFREKPVHRSKSYIVLSSNDKFQSRINQADQDRADQTSQRKPDQSPRLDDSSSIASKRFTSTTNLTSSTRDEESTVSHKQKFSQWRDSILERHKEPSRETQLQSLQVLKSILPQLQKSQAAAAAAADNKSYTATEDVSTTKKPTTQFRFDEQNTGKLNSEVQLRSKNRTQEPAKRYTYCGPPAVSLGSWSERPTLNVQIKTDTDYKIGGQNSSSGGRTVVNLSGRTNVDDVDANAGITTPRPSEQASADNGKDKENRKDAESCVDTSSVNFRELTKAFGQSEVRLRPKALITGRKPQQRHSEYLERSKAELVPTKNNASSAENHVSSTTFANFLNHNSNNALSAVPNIKRYTSVVGITNNNNNANISNNNVSGVSNNASKANFKFSNGQGIKAPTVPLKTFGGGAKNKESVVPKPPTMPIITGVTLKSVNSRSKSGSPTIQADPRDLLLESIRNFGRDKLKSVS